MYHQVTSPNKSDFGIGLAPTHMVYPPPPPTGPGYGASQAPQHPFQAQPYQVPITEPPMSANFYPAPNMPQQAPLGTYLMPQGLESLQTASQFIIEQQVEMLEAFTGYETNNKYIVKNLSGQHLYYAAEENDCCTRNCLGELRPFDIKLYDNQKSEIMRFNRPWRCSSCCFPCCLQELDVFSNGKRLGKIVQEWSLFYPNFSVLNSIGDKVLHIQGPLITFSCGGDVEFTIYSSDGEVKVGRITKQWSGLTRELFTDADRFGIEFPHDLEVSIKAVLLAATFLIDFMYFERGHK